MKRCPACGCPEIDKGVPCGCTFAEKEASAREDFYIISPLAPQVPANDVRWDPQGDVCLSCGAANPDNGNVCGNCGENPQKIPGIITKNQLAIMQLAKEID